MKDYFAGLSITSMICSFTTASYIYVHRQDIKPFGPRMCEELCNRVSGCTKFTFEVADLSCRVDGSANTKRSTKDAVLTRDHLQIIFRGGVLSCPNQFMTIFTWKKKPKCVKYTAMREEAVIKSSPETRLLIVRLHSRSNIKFHQLFLGNCSLKAHPYLRLRRVSAIAVIQKTKRLVIAANRKVMYFPIGTSKITVLKRGITVRSLTVDEDKDVLFAESMGKVKKITLIDRNIQTAFALPRGFSPTAIVLDSSNNVIFAQSSFKILSVTYEGTYTQILVEGKRIFSLSFDPDRSVLYYSQGTELFSFSLLMNISTVLVSIPVTPMNMVYFNNDLYTYGSDGEIGVLRDWKYKQILQEFETHPKGVSMCLLR